MHKNYNNNRS